MLKIKQKIKNKIIWVHGAGCRAPAHVRAPRPCRWVSAQGLRPWARQHVEAQLGKPGRSDQTTARCCHQCGETFRRAVPDLCCLRVENCPTARQSGPPGERNQRICFYRDSALKAGPEKLCWRVCQTSRLSTSWVIFYNNSQQVERLEAKVVEPLKAYGTIVKMKRDDLKATLTARNREAKQLTQLERTRQRNPSDRHVIVSFEFWSLKKYYVRYAVQK